MEFINNNTNHGPQGINTNLNPAIEHDVMTVKNTKKNEPEISPSIQSFVKQTKEDGQEGLTITFSVLPKDNEIKGLVLMEAVLEACQKIGADITNLTIKKDGKSYNNR